ncbi:mitochondrial fission ELM1 family protein [Asticcacaulis machinosus]|uniref:Mitochondrial fission ELM1 family protein n=1 Tax=Asticcacaulis machinosus TaxID=2984211 RepID=A0ABT5HHN3_9CAUL|nr:mitochondrial fission ELM1 family protein [Asticcacaulis machinosus]MDC7675752.1 mitochondrial fission ELM1 family protein [Asticcacaulis machinosus]
MTASDDTLHIPEGRPLTIWAVSDGRAGMENQVLGLAQAIARKTHAQIVTRHIRYRRLFDRWPTFLKLWPDQMLKRDSDPVGPPYPDIWIAAGRATLPHSLRMKAASQGKTLVVQLQDPRANLSAFDLVVAPQHDQVTGDNVLSILGAPHRITKERLAAEFAPWAERFKDFSGPFVAVLIGGKSKSHDLSRDRAETMAADIRRAVVATKGTLLLTISRRTPEAARDILVSALKDLPGLIYTGGGDNPYFAFLHKCDHILVTEDSINMAVEAAATGKPVHILSMDRRSALKSTRKFDEFHRALQDYGAARPFNGELRTWSYTPLNETARAAEAVLALLKSRATPS